LKLVDLIGKPWQRLTKYKLLLYAVLRPLDGADPMFDAGEQKKDIGAMVRQKCVRPGSCAWSDGDVVPSMDRHVGLTCKPDVCRCVSLY